MRFLLALFGGGCLLAGISGAVLSSLGHEEIYFRYLGPLFVFLLGGLFLVAVVANLTVKGHAEVIFFGKVSHKRKRVVYYGASAALIALACLLMAKGVSLYVEYGQPSPERQAEADATAPGEGDAGETE